MGWLTSGRGGLEKIANQYLGSSRIRSKGVDFGLTSPILRRFSVYYSNIRKMATRSEETPQNVRFPSHNWNNEHILTNLRMMPMVSMMCRSYRNKFMN